MDVLLGAVGPAVGGVADPGPVLRPQSLNGTLSRPTVQSTRGSTALMMPPRKFWPFQTCDVSDDGGTGSSGGLSQAELVTASGSPAASTWKKLIRLNEG